MRRRCGRSCRPADRLDEHRVVADHVLYDDAVAGANPIQPANLDGPVRAGGAPDVVQKEQLFTFGAAGGCGAVDEFEPQVGSRVSRSAIFCV